MDWVVVAVLIILFFVLTYVFTSLSKGETRLHIKVLYDCLAGVFLYATGILFLSIISSMFVPKWVVDSANNVRNDAFSL